MTDGRHNLLAPPERGLSRYAQIERYPVPRQHLRSCPIFQFDQLPLVAWQLVHDIVNRLDDVLKLHDLTIGDHGDGFVLGGASRQVGTTTADVVVRWPCPVQDVRFQLFDFALRLMIVI